VVLILGRYIDQTYAVRDEWQEYHLCKWWWHCNGSRVTEKSRLWPSFIPALILGQFKATLQHVTNDGRSRSLL